MELNHSTGGGRMPPEVSPRAVDVGKKPRQKQSQETTARHTARGSAQERSEPPPSSPPGAPGRPQREQARRAPLGMNDSGGGAIMYGTGRRNATAKNRPAPPPDHHGEPANGSSRAARRLGSRAEIDFPPAGSGYDERVRITGTNGNQMVFRWPPGD